MIGTIIDKRYHIIQSLGQGGFGTTFLAEDTKRPGNPFCVVKQFTPASTDPATLTILKRLFDQEAVTLEMLGKHDQIPQLLAHIEEYHKFYIVQEYIKGNDLSDELTLGQKMSESDVIQLLIEILEVLEFVHKYKVIHRDIKPDNIRRRHLDNKIFLIDFGAVKEVRTQLVNKQGQITSTVIIGTPGYMPLEQQRGKPQLSSDVYAVGIIAIQALTGLLPDKLEEDIKTGEIIWRKYVNVSSKLATVLDKMVSYDFRKRHPTAKEALQAVKSLVNKQKIPDFLKKSGIYYGLLGITIVIGLIIFFITKKDDWNGYENSKYGITIKYPKTWERQDLENPITAEVVTFISPKQNDKDNFQEKVTISVDKFSGRLDDWQKSSIQEINNTVSGAKIVDKSVTNLANKEASKLVFTGKNGKDILKNMQVVTLKGDQAYTITYTAKIDDYDQFVETANKMINSLEIN
ncbi:Serine/threonine-protein kinase C [Dolichospermum sp. UHCC 0315A]|uniref:serine/threonine-protein kinase n=1 Tax=Nostocales TaxID=1161 RepID=UPI00029B5FF7|nr:MULTISPECIES: serine/threonine-protein kinase [Nostocales]AFW96452.1 serine/threonine protein kinase [Anabaena sp. 90]MTJ22228.1 serine/threonine protein kinase [Dolichospermum sp. UHCC 0352]QEI41717.1 Serine/threonine-protein kinase C [Dolichospermum sp. UHCC 0315A]